MHDSGASDNGQSASDSVTVDEVTCQQFVELVTHYFEGALSQRMFSRVEEHLVMCDWCVSYLEHMQSTIAALRELREPTSPDPPAAALAALRSNKGDGQ